LLFETQVTGLTQKSQDPQEECLLIVKTAAAIIREDIRSMAYKVGE